MTSHVVQTFQSDEYKIVTDSVASLKEEFSRHISLICDDITTLTSAIATSCTNVESRVDNVFHSLNKG